MPRNLRGNNKDEQAFPTRKMLRLRRKHLPVPETLEPAEFEEWLYEEVIRYQRTGVSTGVLVQGISRAIRNMVALAVQEMGIEDAFEDVLHDLLLYFLEGQLMKFQPFRGRIVPWLRMLGYWKALRIGFPRYHHQRLVEDNEAFEITPDPFFNPYFTEDFVANNVVQISWKMNPALCRWVSTFVLVGSTRKEVIRILRRTFFRNKTRDEAINLYQYVLVKLRIELANEMGRGN